MAKMMVPHRGRRARSKRSESTTKRRHLFEHLEHRHLLTSIEILAAGETGEESVELSIDGQPVAQWSAIGGDGDNGQFVTLQYESDQPITADQIRVGFTNNGVGTVNGGDRNLRVDAVRIDGQRFETEAPSVFSNGTWDPNAQTIVPGFPQSEWLHVNGYFQYGQASVATIIEILAAGETGEESVELQIDSQPVAAWSAIGGDGDNGQFVTLRYETDQTITPDQVRVAFTNNGVGSVGGGDRNLRIDAMLINSERFETESASVFSTGTWDPNTQTIVPGFPESEWLHVNGYFQYDQASVATVIEILAAGETGEETVELQVNAQPVATWSAIGGDGDNGQFVTLRYESEQAITPDQIRVAFTNNGVATVGGGDRNLRVDAIVINGVRYESEGANVFSNGNWDPITETIVPGFRQVEWLHVNGYFAYGQTLNPGSFALETSVVAVGEGDSSVQINVNRTGGSDGQVQLEFATVPISATPGEDYVATSGSLVFADGELQKTITIGLLEDSAIEVDEQFAVTIDSNTAGSLLVPRTATVTIDDNDSVQSAGDGLLGEYFDGLNFSNRFLNRVDSPVNFDWGTQAPVAGMGTDTFSIRWTGRVEPRYSETYTFETRTDDGVRLWVNDQLIIDQWIPQSATSHFGNITLVAGQLYDIRMEYYEQGGDAVAQLLWRSPSQVRQVIPTSQLYAADPPPDSGAQLVRTDVATGLIKPTSIDFSPDGQLAFVGEQRGIIRVIDNGTLQPTPFLDFRARINGTRDRGLIDIAVHPDFDTSPYLYLLYTYDPPEVFQQPSGTLAGPDGNGNRAGRLTRVTADASNGYRTVVPGSEVVLIGGNSTWNNFNGFANSTNDFNEPPAGILPNGTNLIDFINTDSESHTVGAVEFGVGGELFVTIGDGASYNRVDPRGTRVQDIDNLSGKVLRIDPLTGQGLSDNPYFRGNPDENRAKVFQMGLRNPFRAAVNPSSGELFVGDVGWNQWEEVNSGGSGANFGWPYYEGGNGISLRTTQYRNLPEAIAFYNSGAPVDAAVYALNHAQSGINAVVVGDFLTGDSIPSEYRGDLLFNDLGQGIVRNISFAANGSIERVDTFTTGAQVVVQIKQSPDGDTYFVDLDNGTIGRWNFVPSTGAATIVNNNANPANEPEEPEAASIVAINEIIVNTTADDDDPATTSLRDAIEELNSTGTAGMNVIRFNIPAAQEDPTTGNMVIRPSLPLPRIEESVQIVSFDQAATSFPPIQIDGSLLSGSADGLRIAADSVSIHAIAVANFPGDGIETIGVDSPQLTSIFSFGNGRNGVRFNNTSDGELIDSEVFGNQGSGVQITSTSSQMDIRFNQIGGFIDPVSGALVTDGNGTFGIHVLGPDNQIEGNTISGNARSGLVISGSSAVGNQVIGNRIGTDPTGTNAASNGGYGVLVTGAMSNTLGGVSPTDANIVSGNNLAGITLSGGASENSVIGNTVGLQSDQATALGNGSNGIYLRAGATDNHVIGNLIAGNPASQISLVAGTTTGNRISGNLIGFGEDFVPISGGAIAVLVKSPGNTIGGPSPTDANYITGSNTGISMSGVSANRNLIVGNTIGADAAIPGNDHGMNVGIQLVQGARENEIANNTIAYNSSDGIRVPNSGGVGNRITQNSLYGNGFGIDLGPNQFNTNDAGDSDGGPNQLQNSAVSLTANGQFISATEVEITLDYFVNSDPASVAYPLTVEFFVSDSLGQGMQYVSTDTFVATDFTSGSASHTDTIDVSTLLFDADFGTATVTDANGNTSEFTPAVPIDIALPVAWALAPPPPAALDSMDVNGDHAVTAVDALVVINTIVRTNNDGESAYAPSRADVNGDGSVTARDALTIINRLARDLTAATDQLFGDDDEMDALLDDEWVASLF